MTLLAGVAAVAWLVVLLVPWQPWRNRELLPARRGLSPELSDVAVLIPARNEAPMLPATLDALAAQGRGLAVLVVDDGSSDGTAEVARAARGLDVRVMSARPLPPGWSGKVWAQAEGLAHLDRPIVLLLDADIVLGRGMLATLRQRLNAGSLDLVSIMASLPVEGRWERLLVPAFIFFFKLIYPFSLSNRAGSPVAAAAGGCMLLRRAALERAGGFEAVKGALIDDCALAAALKRSGARLWIGQSLDVVSRRRYVDLASFWNMVARTAYTQLERSPVALALVTVAMLVSFVAPLAGLLTLEPLTVALSLLALALMTTSYLPCVRLYGVPLAWALTLPVAGALFLLMTWSSAKHAWRGEVACWHGRRYPASDDRFE